MDILYIVSKVTNSFSLKSFCFCTMYTCYKEKKNSNNVCAIKWNEQNKNV